MRFLVLGPIEVLGSGGPAKVAGARQLVLLATLLLNGNRVVPLGDLVDALWDDGPPPNADVALRTYVSRLRRAIAAVEPDADRRLTFASGGYRLTVEPGELDLDAFREHVRRARAGDRPEDVATELSAGLRLWRGPALIGLAGRRIQTNAAGLAEERLAATVERIAADLALGHAADLVPELRDLVAAHPLREQLHGQLMLALYRSGRQADALLAFQDARTVIAEELGGDPGPELVRLHEDMLRGAPALAAPPQVDQRPRRDDLPGDIADFTGRDTELRDLLGELPEGGAVAIEAIDGMAGIGKTALAVHLAHRLADRYPDARLFIDLHGHSTEREAASPAAALDVLLRALGVPGERIPPDLDTRSALWRAELADRRALVVLDNAASAAQVRPLLPGGPNCLALVTSRRRLADLDTTRTVSLDVLPPDDAVALFTRIAGRDRADGEPDAVRAVVELCGRLPLAIRIAGARLRTRRTWTVAHLAGRLRQGHRRLAELTTGDRSVAAAFALSYQHLSADQQGLFRLLGLVPGHDFDAYAAAALDDRELGPTTRLLEDLVDVHLLQEPVAGRYRFHDLLRQHARNTVAATETAQQRDAALDRLLDYYLHAANAVNDQVDPSGRRITLGGVGPPARLPAFDSYDAGLAWCEAEHANLIAAIAHAAEQGRHTHTWQLSHLMWSWFQHRSRLHDWLRTHQLALASARELDDARGQAEIHNNLGTAHTFTGQYELALEHTRQALPLYRSVGDRRGEASATNRTGVLHKRLGQHQEAIDHFELAHALCEEIGDRRGEAATLNNLGLMLSMVGRHEDALDRHLRALDLDRQLGDQRNEGMTLNNLGSAHRKLGRHEEAIGRYRRSLAIHREIGDTAGVASTLSNLALAYGGLGRHADALHLQRQALALAEELDEPDAVGSAHNDLGDTMLATGRPDLAGDHYRQALDISAQTGSHYEQGRAHVGLGRTRRAEDPAAATEHLRQALEIYARLGLPEAEAVRAELAAIPGE
ncbi:tetratricopeptide repeat protein [Solihabitans fulvus]|uniref:Tetratricopeptide repeat protein n=1 Tax=Solihabitans fulvus TaxID=1892852 RepID=A0A5B2WTL2_9PSEU|nr:AfsR/SARP family transcriptional regulator [Solihabitans fulvus]KAA2253876.1 tetratricopeptide repeat protein [Solihabitans fulvus]